MQQMYKGYKNRKFDSREAIFSGMRVLISLKGGAIFPREFNSGVPLILTRVPDSPWHQLYFEEYATCRLPKIQKKKKLRRLVPTSTCTFMVSCPRSVSLAYMSYSTSSAVPVVGIRKAGASRLTKTAASARVNEWKQFLSFATRVWQVHFVAGE